MPLPSKHPLNPLGIALTRLLEARHLSDTDFARKAGISKALVSQIKHRQPAQLPKRMDVDRWVRILGLNKAEAAALREATELAWSPKGIQELVAKLNRK